MSEDKVDNSTTEAIADPAAETAAAETAAAETAAETATETAAETTVNVEPVAAMQVAVGIALDRKAEQLKVLDLAAISDFTDLFLICSGINERQVQAIADGIVKALREEGTRPLHVEGMNRGQWVLLDFGGDFVMHIFLEETRRFYGLEGLWSDAPDITSAYS